MMGNSVFIHVGGQQIRVIICMALLPGKCTWFAGEPSHPVCAICSLDCERAGGYTRENTCDPRQHEYDTCCAQLIESNFG